MERIKFESAKNILLLLAISSFIYSNLIFAQTPGVQPTSIGGSNSLSFDVKSNTYDFYRDGILCYSYEVTPGVSKTGGSFNVLKAFDFSGSYLLPSNFGGIRAILDGAPRYPFDSGVSFKLLNQRILTGDTVMTYWEMMYRGDYIKYKYKFKISGRTLVIRVEVDPDYADKAVSLELDRCEHAENPSAIGIPYLPLFYVLYANNMFTSLYADWETSNASQIIVCDGSAYSKNSVKYAQNLIYNEKTDHHRNRMSETLYLTTSLNIADVFPNIPNPVSKYRQETPNWIIWDFRPAFNQLISPSPERYLEKVYRAGVRNIWLQIHNWQANHGNGPNYGYTGYDDGLPCVLPANNYYGGNSELNAVISKAREYKFRVGLHENYVDYYPNSCDCTTGPGYTVSDVALKTDGEKLKAFKNIYYKGTQSYFLKPSRAGYYADTWSKLIQESFPELDGCYLDVNSSILPTTNNIDYDATDPGAGKFRELMEDYRALFGILKKNHHGPVQGEGGNQIFYQGYADDIEARIEIPNKYAPGNSLPILVDFDMLKLRPKAFVHGVGYYPIFYTKSDYRTPRATKEIVLQYIATELAFGHGGYIPTPDLTWDRDDSIIAHAELEYKYVFSVQKDYANAEPVEILYNDNNSLESVSDYIRNHPSSYDDITSQDFMGQVKVVYDNGVIVCVNRHPFRSWKVEIGDSGGWFDYHADGKLYTGVSSTTTFTLPPKNGWVVYDPFK